MLDYCARIELRSIWLFCQTSYGSKKAKHRKIKLEVSVFKHQMASKKAKHRKIPIKTFMGIEKGKNKKKNKNKEQRFEFQHQVQDKSNKHGVNFAEDRDKKSLDISKIFKNCKSKNKIRSMNGQIFNVTSQDLMFAAVAPHRTQDQIEKGKAFEKWLLDVAFYNQEKSKDEIYEELKIDMYSFRQMNFVCQIIFEYLTQMFNQTKCNSNGMQEYCDAAMIQLHANGVYLDESFLNMGLRRLKKGCDNILELESEKTKEKEKTSK